MCDETKSVPKIFSMKVAAISTSMVSAVAPKQILRRSLTFFVMMARLGLIENRRHTAVF